MIDTISSLSVHKVGNKAQDEPIVLSSDELQLSDDLRVTLAHYFSSSFKSNEYFNLYHESDLELNEVFSFVTNIFENPEGMHKQSIKLARHLHEKSDHPKIKSGEFYVAYFEEAVIAGEVVDAVGLFKSENKDTFLQVHNSGEEFNIESQQGVNINKLDKGALIFNTDKENGYVVAVVDNTNRATEAHYWIDEFLHLRQRQDDYYNTQNVISLAKSFVTKELPKEFEVSRADQVDLLNKSAEFFKKNDTFDMGEFATEVIGQPEVIESFNRYKEEYAQEREIEFSDTFSISDSAAKKGARALKSVIKLDKNFHIYIHGDRSKIETGQDSKGKFYKVYFDEES